MAWSPVRRVNAGLVRVEAPGNYATLNSNQLRDGTAFLSHNLIVRIAIALTRAELIEDPREIVTNPPCHAAYGFTADAQSFPAWYLFSHRLIKLELVAAVLPNGVWVYSASIVAIIGFIPIRPPG